MYCEHFLPAVYWSLMTWAARWSNVLGAEELLLLAFSSTTRGASIFRHLWGGDFLTPFFLQFCWYTPRGLPEWLNLLSREVHDPFGETKLCALGLQAHQCLKMLISLGVGDMKWWGWVWPNDVKSGFCCLLCLLQILSDSKRWTYSNPPWCWCLARPTQPIPLHPGRDPGPPICLDGMATGPFIDSWIEMKEQKINEHHMTSIYISYILGSGEFILAPS